MSSWETMAGDLDDAGRENQPAGHDRLVLSRELAKLAVGLLVLGPGLLLVVAWGDSGKPIGVVVSVPLALAFLARVAVGRAWRLPETLYLERKTRICVWVFQAVMSIAYAFFFVAIWGSCLGHLSWCH